MSRIDIEQFGSDLRESPVIAILRGVTPATILEVCEALRDAGIRFVETTMNSPDPSASIRRAAEGLGGDIHVGAGTVLQPDQVDAVAAAGGTYIISPNFSPAVVRRTKELGLISIPGFFTPSEGFAAVDAGADYLKWFPARALGPGYLRDLAAVLPHPVLAVGGVGLGNVQEFLSVAAAVGVGSALYSSKKSASEIRQDAAEFLHQATQNRGT